MSSTFTGVTITQNGTHLIINASNIPNNWNGRGIYINASETVAATNGINIPAYTILYPDNTSQSIQSFSGTKHITFTGSDYNDYLKGGNNYTSWYD